MAIKYGIDFPFKESNDGSFLKMTLSPEREIRANLIHLLLTKKGSRYFMPDFGTRLYQFIFEQNDINTFHQIEDEIREVIKKYIPNIELTNITVTSADNDTEQIVTYSQQEDERLFRVSDASTKQYTARVKIEYSINNGAFSSSDFVIINI